MDTRSDGKEVFSAEIRFKFCAVFVALWEAALRAVAQHCAPFDSSLLSNTHAFSSELAALLSNAQTLSRRTSSVPENNTFPAPAHSAALNANPNANVLTVNSASLSSSFSVAYPFQCKISLAQLLQVTRILYSCFLHGLVFCLH